MAKYISNYSYRNNAVQYCAVLDENCLANTYTVRFSNGVIKNVSKRRVIDLDALDEGVLDRLKEIGRSLLDNIVKAGKYVWFTMGNKVVNAFSPINMVKVANDINGLSFVPSPQTAELCTEVGINPQVVIDEEDDLEFLADANAYWENIIEQYENGEIDEPGVNESLSGKFTVKRKLYEAKAHPDIKMEHAAWDNMGTSEVIEALVNQFNDYRHGAGLPGEDHPIPYCIWGAPGVGKTQIINSIITAMREEGYPANIMGLNALTMRKDDLSLPGQSQITHNVKNSKGEEISFVTARAVELPKSWLPLYDPADTAKGLTLEQLDDIANGGDGSGNGEGGFIFLDELSRIEISVMNVFMTLVQSRTFNGMILGSKWMFVAAANRTTDMGTAGEMVEWEAAYTGRFTHINFVPTLQEWLSWASAPLVSSKANKAAERRASKSLSALRKDRHSWLDKQERIHSDYIAFIKEHPGFWYSSLSYNDEDTADKVSQTMYPNPRGWENTSKERRSYEYAKSLAENPEEGDTFVSDMYKKLKLRPNLKMNVLDKARFMKHNLGNKAANSYINFSKLDILKDSDAKQVWTKGSKAPVPFASNLMSDGAVNLLEKVCERILANHPDYEKAVEENRNINLTPTEFKNLVTYIGVAINDYVDKSQTDTVFNSIWATLTILLGKTPYEIDLAFSQPGNPTYEKYKDTFILVNKYLKKSKAEIANRR